MCWQPSGLKWQRYKTFLQREQANTWIDVMIVQITGRNSQKCTTEENLGKKENWSSLLLIGFLHIYIHDLQTYIYIYAYIYTYTYEHIYEYICAYKYIHYIYTHIYIWF